MLSLSQKIQALYSELQEPEDWEGIVIKNDLDNPDPYIAEWVHSTLARPTEEQLAAVDETAYQASLDLKVAKANRAAAYAAESDALFFKSQRGEATTEEWTSKVAEIKARFPYPGGEG